MIGGLVKFVARSVWFMPLWVAIALAPLAFLAGTVLGGGIA